MWECAMRVRVAGMVFGSVLLLGVVTNLSVAGAAPPEFPHGVGVCVSQVAIEPGLAGADRLGDLVRTAGGDMPVVLDDLRGDGPGGCGGPPGPGHLR
jgi:hypothetical protein